MFLNYQITFNLLLLAKLSIGKNTFETKEPSSCKPLYCKEEGYGFVLSAYSFNHLQKHIIIWKKIETNSGILLNFRGYCIAPGDLTSQRCQLKGQLPRSEPLLTQYIY